MPNSDDRHVVLVGLMGAGKSTLGRRLAAKLGRPFFDSDDLVESTTGRTVREIWLTDGEAAFRVMETDVLRASLAATTPSVIAAAGGVVLSPSNRDALRDSGARVVWLRADPARLVQRVRSGTHRPLLDDDPLAALRHMDSERATLYSEVATDQVDTTEHSVEELLEMLSP